MTRDEMVEQIQAVLDRAAAETDGLELGAVDDWVLVCAVSDATDRSRGAIEVAYPPDQWTHRTVGLLMQGGQELVDDPE